MPRESSTVYLALTSNGVDGACAAAIVLMKYPHACVRITSPRHLPVALSDYIELGTPDAVLICGLGYDGTEERLMSALALARKKARITWCSSRRHPEIFEMEARLAQACKLVLSDTETDAESVFKALRVPRGSQAELVLELAEEATKAKKPRSELHRLWRNVIEASNHKYFLFGDESYNDRMMMALAGLRPLDEELKQAASEFERQEDRLYPLGASKAMLKIRKEMGRFGPVPEPVLIQGPTGAGKELVARGLHITSRRSGRFVAMNCAVLGGNPQLAEDRLFGHVKGAYTSALTDKAGAFEEADHGTLFLDEIGELPLDVQSQLLRVLEEKTVRPVGTMESRSVDVRIVAATHRTLTSMVKAGTFRDDLHYRLNVLRIQVPPLRERPDDMRSIAAHARTALGKNGYLLRLTKADWDALNAYDWPGNVRQFLNVLKRAAYLGEPVGQVLLEEREDIGYETAGTPDDLRLLWPKETNDVVPAEEVYRVYVNRVFHLFGGHIVSAANALKIAPNTLRKYLD